MTLILIRHADASNDDPRPLTDAGRQQHARVAGALRRMGITVERLLSSPLLRARETAEITAGAVGFRGAVEETPALGDDFTVEGLLASSPLTLFLSPVGGEGWVRG
ncbi:MAG: histidine phosphatase family protein, partial [Candidatus Rokubacteria bacterium]|nr:histidine phosphatase family protein [Candidatus Rokubacteria bacterium]